MAAALRRKAGDLGAEPVGQVRDRTLRLRRRLTETLHRRADSAVASDRPGLGALAASKLLGEPGACVPGASGTLPLVPYRLVTGYGPQGLVSVAVQRTDLVAELVSERERLTLEFRSRRHRRRVVLRAVDGGAEIPLSGHDRRWVAGLDAINRGPETEWCLVVTDRAGTEHAVLAPIPAHDDPPLKLGDGDGALAAVVGPELEWRLVPHTAEVQCPVRVDEPSSLIVVGPLAGADGTPQPLKLRLHHRVASLEVPVSADDHGVGRVHLGALERYGRTIPLRTGSWRLEVLSGGSWRGVGAPDTTRMTTRDEASGVRYLTSAGPSGVVVRSVELPRTDGPWGRTQQRRAREIPARLSADPLKPAVVFECFWGRQAGDNPLALERELAEFLPEFERHWVINPGHTYAPPGTRPLVRWTEEWYEVMASASLVVTNAALAPYFRRREGQVVVQTWHGTPLKRLGLDMLTFEHMGDGYERDLVTQSAQWSYLVSPNSFCSEVFPGAFGYSGPLLEVGSPRNDVLAHDDSPATRARLRADLGIDPDASVVLVAPTFRDGVRRNGAIHSDVDIDLDHLAQRLGDRAIVLFRAHNYVASSDTGSSGAQVINVSDHPDIADLYRISDLLVTDYSSVMFDYAVTGRPMVFHCPDLADYRDRLRGFYFDFEATAPGPITADGDALVECVRDGLQSGVPLSHRAAYDDWVKRYAGWEEGTASRRIAEIVAAEVNPN